MYKLISPSNYFSDDLLTKVCNNRKVELTTIKNVTADSIIPYALLNKIDKVVAAIIHYASNPEAIIGLIIDSDCDGYTSSTIMYRYLVKNFPNVKIVWYMHDGKQHGITDEARDWAIEQGVNLLIVPDAGSSDYDNHKILREKEILVTVIDHHETEGDSEDALVVNSQLSPEYTNKDFSGVGITYKVLQAIDEQLGFNDADTYLDLVSVGNIADSMSMVEPETRYYVYEGIQHLQNEALKEMIFQFIGKWDLVNPHSLAFNVIPKINGAIRMGTLEEKQDLFKALVGLNLDEIHINEKARSEKTREETFLKKAVRQAKNAHARQNNAKKKWMQKFEVMIEEQGLNNNSVLVIVLTEKDKFDKNLTGVLAGALTNKYLKPAVILTLDEKTTECSGSLRGYDRFSLDTKGLFEATGLFEWVKGHGNAAGCCIKQENIAKLDEALKEIHKFDLEDNKIPVDFVMPINQLSRKVVEDVDSYTKYWGKGLEPVKFAITGVKADFKTVKISSGGKITIEVNGVEFTQFTADDRFKPYAETDNDVTMDVVGTMSLNHYMGKVTHQFVIEDFEIISVEDNSSNKYKFVF